MHVDGDIRFARGTALALCLFAAFPASASAEGARGGPGDAPAPAATSPDPAATSELSRLEVFLDQHPNIEIRLRENPEIIDNPAFQRNHPLLTRFLARHPEVRAELAARPRWFVHRELIRQSAGPVTWEQLAEFDRFLDQHPRLDRLLVQHPRLLRQPEFLNDFPELHDYLRRHPGNARAIGPKSDRPTKAERRN